MSPPPNILLIITDQQARAALGAAGNPHLQTPHMDSLAARGVRFVNAYCTAPVCGPARASLLTGRMPHEVCADVLGALGDPAPVDVGHLVRDAGYQTAWAGKWHAPELYPPTTGARMGGFEHLPIPRPDGLKTGEGSDDQVAEVARDFLRLRHDRPFLLGVSFTNPHDVCYQVRHDRPDHPPTSQLPPLPPNFDAVDHEVDFIRWCRQRDHYGEEVTYTRRWDEVRWRVYLHDYYRLVEQVDREVGKVLGALADAGLADDTVVIFTSDHGEGTAAHRWVVKLMLYEEPVTIPLIVAWPGLTDEGRVDGTHLVSMLDLLPTLCDIAGAPAPPDLAGRSWRAPIAQPQRPGHAFVVSELQPDTERPELKARMLRTRRHKYLCFSHGERREMLFDLEADPGETSDLAPLADSRGLLDEHRRTLRAWCERTGDGFEVPRPGG